MMVRSLALLPSPPRASLTSPPVPRRRERSDRDPFPPVPNCIQGRSQLHDALYLFYLSRRTMFKAPLPFVYEGERTHSDADQPSSAALPLGAPWAYRTSILRPKQQKGKGRMQDIALERALGSAHRRGLCSRNWAGLCSPRPRRQFAHSHRKSRTRTLFPGCFASVRRGGPERGVPGTSKRWRLHDAKFRCGLFLPAHFGRMHR